MKIDSVRNILKKSSCDALLISSVPNIIYLTRYAGFSKDEREAYLLITKSRNYIITDGRYEHAINDLKDVEPLIHSHSQSIQDIFKNLAKKHAIISLGIEENDIKIKEYKMLKKNFKKLVSANLNTLRITKTPDETANIEKACNLGDKTFTHILPFIKKGISEKQIAFEMELFIKKHMGDVSFPTIVAFGKNSAIPHHQTGDQKLKVGDIVLLDFGVKINNYSSDMTRTVFFGKAPDKFKSIYQTVLTAQQKSFDYLKSSILNHKSKIKASNVDRVARDYIISQGFPSIPHSLGHGIGIEVHEPPYVSPKSNSNLEERMVFSVEPGIYLPEFGGVRIEDLVVLEEKGPRLLTQAPRELIELKI